MNSRFYHRTLALSGAAAVCLAGLMANTPANALEPGVETQSCMAAADGSVSTGEVPLTVQNGGRNYELVWNDEFCGESVNRNKWLPRAEPQNGGMKYTNIEGPKSDPKSNIFLENGALNLRAKIQGDGQSGWPRSHSAMLTTEKTAAWKYGRFEIRVRTSGQVGTWPAFWMMPTQNPHGWPRDGEIDWFENIATDPSARNTNFTSVHSSTKYWESRRSNADHAVSASFGLPADAHPGLHEDYHTWQMEWDEGEFRFYHDGNLYNTVKRTWTNSWVADNGVLHDSDKLGPFDKKFFFIVNLATNGWGGNFNKTTDLANHPFQIDYVRVYQTPEQQDGQQRAYVKYFMNGFGKPITERSGVAQGSQLGVLPKPTDPHATFNGWYYDRKFAKRARPGDIVYDDTTLFARWTPREHRVDALRPAGSVFTDVGRYTAYAGEIADLKKSGITTGWDDGTYRPYEPIERNAMAAFLYRLAGSPNYTPTKVHWKDVPRDAAFFKEIAWLSDTGITKGWSDGTFRPYEPINRDAMAAFLYRFCDKYPGRCAAAVNPRTYPKVYAPEVFKDVVHADVWGRKTTEFYDEIAWATRAGITTGWADGTFRPVEPINRDAMAAFIYRLRHNR